MKVVAIALLLAVAAAAKPLDMSQRLSLFKKVPAYVIKVGGQLHIEPQPKNTKKLVWACLARDHANVTLDLIQKKRGHLGKVTVDSVSLGELLSKREASKGKLDLDIYGDPSEVEAAYELTGKEITDAPLFVVRTRKGGDESFATFNLDGESIIPFYLYRAGAEFMLQDARKQRPRQQFVLRVMTLNQFWSDLEKIDSSLSKKFLVVPREAFK